MGRNVLDGRWTYQTVGELDAIYCGPVMKAEFTEDVERAYAAAELRC